MNDRFTLAGKTWTKDEWIKERTQSYVNAGVRPSRASVRAREDWADLEADPWWYLWYDHDEIDSQQENR